MPTSHTFRDARARALEAAGGIAYWQGEMPAAQAFYDECLELTREGGDKKAIANAIYNDAFPMSVNRTNLEQSLVLYGEALPLFRELSDDTGVSRCLGGIANNLYYQGKFDESIVALDEAIELFRKTGDRFSLGWALHTRALAAIKKADMVGARALVVEALQLFAGAGDISGVVVVLDDAAQVERSDGNRTLGIRLAGAAAAHQATSGAGLAQVLNVEEDRDARDDLTDESGKQAWAEGQAMTIEQAVALAVGGAK
jgi:tetratricopeptide (TPR) repeat protein